MKKTALTILLAGALLCAGCSDSTETTAVVSPTPAPEATLSAVDKAELDQKLAINNLPPVDATVTPTPSATP
jgi:PBP1b-binding outer membrane lipoprotein LpoB